MSDETRARSSVRRVTLDGQLLTYWEREALRLEALAKASRWSWRARGFLRKAERARQQADQFGAREAARARGEGPLEPEAS